MTIKECARAARELRWVRDVKTGEKYRRIFTIGLAFDQNGNDHEYVEVLDRRANALYVKAPEDLEIVKEEKEK